MTRLRHRSLTRSRRGWGSRSSLQLHRGLMGSWQSDPWRRGRETPRRSAISPNVAGVEAPAASHGVAAQRRHVVVAQAVVAPARHLRRHVTPSGQRRQSRALVPTATRALPRPVPAIFHGLLHTGAKARRHRGHHTTPQTPPEPSPPAAPPARPGVSPEQPQPPPDAR